MSVSSEKNSKSYDEEKKKESKLEFTCHVFYACAVTTEKKKTVKKPKLPDVYSEQRELLSDDDSEFSETSSKGIEEKLVGHLTGVKKYQIKV